MMHEANSMRLMNKQYFTAFFGYRIWLCVQWKNPVLNYNLLPSLLLMGSFNLSDCTVDRVQIDLI